MPINLRKITRKSLRENYESYRNTRRRILATLKNNKDGLDKLVQAGIIKSYEDYNLRWGIAHNIQPNQLFTIRRTLGQLEHLGNSVCEKYDKQPDDYIRVDVGAKDYPNLRFRYFKQLDPRKKCKIVTEVKTVKTLVCEN